MTKRSGFSSVEVCVVGTFSLGGVLAYFTLLKRLCGQGSVLFEGIGVFFLAFLCSAKVMDVWQNKRREKWVDAQKSKL